MRSARNTQDSLERSCPDCNREFSGRCRIHQGHREDDEPQGMPRHCVVKKGLTATGPCSPAAYAALGGSPQPSCDREPVP